MDPNLQGAIEEIVQEIIDDNVGCNEIRIRHVVNVSMNVLHKTNIINCFILSQDTTHGIELDIQHPYEHGPDGWFSVLVPRTPIIKTENLHNVEDLVDLIDQLENIIIGQEGAKQIHAPDEYKNKKNNNTDAYDRAMKGI